MLESMLLFDEGIGRGLSIGHGAPGDDDSAEIEDDCLNRHVWTVRDADGVGNRAGAVLYNDRMAIDRITVRSDQMSGEPCIRGLRIPVATVVYMVADGMSHAEILTAYPDLEADDIRQALRFAARAVDERILPMTTV